MKIVAQTAGGYLLEATAGEIAGLCGADTMPKRQYYPHDSIGIEFNINRCWDRIKNLKWKQDELKKVCGQLRAMAELLEPISTVVETLDEQERTTPPDGVVP